MKVRGGNHAKLSEYRGKRLLDLAMSSALLAVTIPVMGASAVAVRVTSGSPVFFTQPRCGLNGNRFQILKLRTMTPAGEVTPLGRLLRSYKIDELPQLWNVVKGDMSMVGPRPCLPETAREALLQGSRRFEVKPGITGLAQVSGNTDLSWVERWALDDEYVRKASPVLDLRIICATVRLLPQTGRLA